MSQPALPAAPMSMPAPQVEIDESSQCDGRYMRCSVKTLPSTAQVASASKLPLGVVCQPMALDSHQDAPLDVVNFGSTGIVRCKKCRAYVNPFVAWVNNGRQWRCNVCGFSNDVPNSYFCQLDERGRRRDRDQRPELCKGCVELVAPGEYMVRPPQPPVYVFVADVSAVHFFHLKSSLSAPQMLSVPDLAELFLPLPDDLLVNLADSRDVIDALLDSLPAMFTGTRNMESCLGPAVTAAYRVMGHIGGKMCVFQSTLPSLGEGKLKHRENPRAYGSDAEHALFKPDDEKWYQTKAIEFSRLQICVELFLFSHQYCDVSTLSALPKYTAGQLYHYPAFAAASQGDKFEADLAHALTRPTAFEAVMRVRCTKGLKVSAFFGNFFVRGTDLLALPNCTPDSTYALEISHEEETTFGAQLATMQAALLYTSSSGER